VENNESNLPREKMFRQGVRTLDDADLISVILGSGITGKPVRKLAQEVLIHLDSRNDSDYQSVLSNVRGLGLAKSSRLIAALEFSRRRIRPEGIQIRRPEDTIPLVSHYASKKQEHFLTLSLSGAKELIALRCTSVGLVNATQVHPREVFADPIQDRASSIIVLHNHPSGHTTPSEADRRVTKNLIEAGKILGIPLLDHIIFTTSNRFLSLRETEVSLDW